MAGLISSDDSLEEIRSLIRTNLFHTEKLFLPNHNVAYPSSSIPSAQTTPRTTDPQAAAITSPPHLLELRQNNPQDCSNLITASVNRATVEISRTIIALNATFSQQLQQASVSASNGIKSAQNSATSTIQIVVLSASSATSSAFSSLTIANLAVTSANFALTNAQSSASTALAVANSSLILANLAMKSISSASSRDVSTLSSSLSDLQASLTSVQSSASAAIFAAQSALAFASESAAAQASSILASAASATQKLTTSAPQQTLPTLQLPTTISLTPAQTAAIVAGAVVLTIFLSFLIYFLALKMKKRKGRDSYLDEKDVTSSPKKLPSRMSAALRTGNAMTLKFNPPRSSDAPPPPKLAQRIPEKIPEPTSMSERKRVSQASSSEINLLRQSSSSIYSEPLSWPLTIASTKSIEPTAVKPLSQGLEFWPLKIDAPSHPHQLSPERRKEPLTPNLLNKVKTDHSIPYTSPALEEIFDEHDIYEDEEVLGEVNQRTNIVSSSWEQIHQRGETPDEIVFNPFEGGLEELACRSADGVDIHEQQEEPEISERLVEQTQVQQIPARDSYSETANFFRTLETRIQHKISPTSPSKTPQELSRSPIEEHFNQMPTQSIHEEPQARQAEEWSFGQLLPGQPTRVPKAETLDFLKEDQARSSMVPEIDRLLRIVAQDNERIADKPLFWSDFRPVEEEVEVAMDIPFVREREEPEKTSPEEKSLQEVEDQDGLEKKEERQTVVSPFLHNQHFPINHIEGALLSPKVEKSDNTRGRDSSPSPPTPKAGREISPLRMNPHIRNIISLLAEHDSSPPGLPALEVETKDVPDDREARGRSMLRTSDIIEARPSSIFAAKEAKYTYPPNASIDLAIKERARTISPLRWNPVDPSNPSDQRNRTLSPLQRNPSTTSTSTKRKSRTLSPSLPRLKLTLNKTSLESREESPLRRNPLFRSEPLTPPTMPTSDYAASRTHSNVTFNQNLARFQNLAEQSLNGRQASTEVTQRAIAGIFIPGSLREQAVRNLSKSRERLGGSVSTGKEL